MKASKFTEAQVALVAQALRGIDAIGSEEFAAARGGS